MAEYIPITAAIFFLKCRKMKKLCPYRDRFCGCMRNSVKTAPKNSPILLMICEGSKTMKKARYRNENYIIGIAVIDLFILEKNFKLLAQLHHTIYREKFKFICFCTYKYLWSQACIQDEADSLNSKKRKCRNTRRRLSYGSTYIQRITLVHSTVTPTHSCINYYIAT